MYLKCCVMITKIIINEGSADMMEARLLLTMVEMPGKNTRMLLHGARHYKSVGFTSTRRTRPKPLIALVSGGHDAVVGHDNYYEKNAGPSIPQKISHRIRSFCFVDTNERLLTRPRSQMSCPWTLLPL